MAEEKSRGQLKREEHKARAQREELRHGFVYELTLGLPSIAVNTVLLMLGLYLLSLIYKLGAVADASTGAVAVAGNGFFDGYSDLYYTVHPFAGCVAVLLVFVLKNIYDIRFYRLQMDAKDAHKKGVRIFAWFLYILITIWYIVLTFLFFMCGKTFWETYGLENAFMDNFCHTILFILAPLCYPIQAMVRFVMQKVKDKKKA